MTKAKAMKIDEFYTQFSDIEEELVHYKKFFFKKKFIVVATIQNIVIL